MYHDARPSECQITHASEVGWKGIRLEKTEEGTEDLRESFVLRQNTHTHTHTHTHTTNTGSGQIPSLNCVCRWFYSRCRTAD
jgi:hypothetical protein